MAAAVVQAGEVVSFESQCGWVEDLLVEAVRPQLLGLAVEATVRVSVERSGAPFIDHRCKPAGRGVWLSADALVLENACTSGFDLELRPDDDVLCVRARWRPPKRERIARRLLNSRFHLLARCVLLQYPAMAWAARRGYAPLHAVVCQTGEALPLLVGPGGVGRSTLVLAAVDEGAVATSDNLCVCNGVTVCGLAEPARVAGGSGRRMPHGRRERAVSWTTSPVMPDSVHVLRRGDRESPTAHGLSSLDVERELVAATYAAGELMRFWPFVANLSLLVPDVPAHPPVAAVAAALAARLPATEIRLARSAIVPLPELAELVSESL